MDEDEKSLRPTVGRTAGVLAAGFAISVPAGFLLAWVNAPPALFYAFAAVLSAAVVMQILAPGAGLRSPLESPASDEPDHARRRR